MSDCCSRTDRKTKWRRIVSTGEEEKKKMSIKGNILLKEVKKKSDNWTSTVKTSVCCQIKINKSEVFQVSSVLNNPLTPWPLTLRPPEPLIPWPLAFLIYEPLTPDLFQSFISINTFVRKLILFKKPGTSWATLYIYIIDIHISLYLYIYISIFIQCILDIYSLASPD